LKEQGGEMPAELQKSIEQTRADYEQKLDACYAVPVANSRTGSYTEFRGSQGDAVRLF
jgi:hypothetical protein